MGTVYAAQSDVEAIWQPIPDTQSGQVDDLLAKASARLQQKCPFDIDDRIERFEVDRTDPFGLDPLIVADVVAQIVKRVLVNPNGVVSTSETAGPFSRSLLFTSRYSRTDSAAGSLAVTDADVEQLRPAQPSFKPGTVRLEPGKRPAIGFNDGDPWRERSDWLFRLVPKP